jgi:ElaA protein
MQSEAMKRSGAMSEALRRIWAKDLNAETLYELLKLRV